MRTADRTEPQKLLQFCRTNKGRVQFVVVFNLTRLAAFAQFDNDVLSDRTRAGMQEALRRGRWTFLGPLGYLNAPRAMRQSLIPDPEQAPTVRRLFKQYATGTCTNQEALTEGGASRMHSPTLTSDTLKRNRTALI